MTMASTFIPFSPCLNASDYVDATTVAFGGALGSVYSPRCVRVRTGASLTFSGSFSSHPLSPSPRNSGGTNPIPVTSSGTSVSVPFPTAGFYSFYCTFHGSAAGTGMSGVVQVTP